MEQDSYYTISQSAEATFKDKGSKFYAYAYPVVYEDEIRNHLNSLYKQYYDATHHCYAWRLGPKGELSRANDDGEPSGTAGRPILGQILSRELTNILLVVVRYFGGTKLGVPGLINAYKESSRAVIDQCEIIEKTVNVHFKICFSYLIMNDVMRVIKELHPNIVSQTFDNLCEMVLSIRQGQSETLADRLGKYEGITIEVIGYK